MATKTPPRPKPDREIATTGDGRDITRGFISGLDQPQDSILLSRGGGDLKIYEEVLKDAQVKTVVSQRNSSVVQCEWNVQPGGESAQDKAAAAFLKEQLDNAGWDNITNKMLYGVFYGYAVSEIIYGRDGRYLALDKIKVRNRRRFRFTPKGELRLLTPDNMMEGEPCPAPYFWHYATGSDNDDEPYGLGLAHYLYWPVFFKKNGIKFWLIFLEKFGMPTAIGRYGINTSKKEKARLLEALRAIQTDSAMIMPEGMSAELLEAARSGTADYKTLHDTMDATIAKVVLGQTASTQGTAGKLGNEDLQGEVRKDLIKADADLICESFNMGPARWLTDWNFPGAAYPQVSRNVEIPEDANERSERDERVCRFSGFKPTLAYIRETYGIEVDETIPRDTGSQSEKTAEFAEPSAAPRDPAEAMTPRLAQQMQPAIAQWVQELQAMVEAGDSLESIRDRLLEIAPTLSLDEYTQLMQPAIAAAELAGRNDVQDEIGAD